MLWPLCMGWALQHLWVPIPHVALYVSWSPMTHICVQIPNGNKRAALPESSSSHLLHCRECLWMPMSTWPACYTQSRSAKYFTSMRLIRWVGCCALFMSRVPLLPSKRIVTSSCGKPCSWSNDLKNNIILAVSHASMNSASVGEWAMTGWNFVL